MNASVIIQFGESTIVLHPENEFEKQLIKDFHNERDNKEVTVKTTRKNVTYYSNEQDSIKIIIKDISTQP